MKILDSNIVIYSYQPAFDSIVAATALLHGAELQTRNVADFQKIPDLKVINPIP